MIDEETKKQLGEVLRDEQAKIEADLAVFTIKNKAAPGGHESILAETGNGSSPEDQADTMVAFEKMTSVEHMLEKRLEEIKKALALIDTPQYGLCEKCGKEIPLERLKVNPAAMTCIEHAPKY